MLRFPVFLLTILVVLLVVPRTFAQPAKSLLDSARSIFRANPVKAKHILLNAKKIAQQKEDFETLVNIQLILGNISYFGGEHKQALSLYLVGLQIAEKQKMPALIAAVCNEIGTLLKRNKSLDEALSYYERSLQQARLAKNESLEANAFNNVGLVYEERGDYEKALKQYQFSMLAYTKANDKLGQSYSLEYIGYVYGLMKNFKPAIENLQQSLSLREQLEDNFGIAICLNELAEVYKNAGNFDKAMDYARRAVWFSKKIGYPDMQQQGYFLLSELNEKRGNFKEAFKAHQSYLKVKDSLFNIANSKQINELQTKYETVKKQQQITLLNKENTIQKLQLSQRDFAIVAITAAFVAVVFIGFLMYNRYKLQQNARLQKELLIQQELATRAVLSAEEAERNRISAELHDGLGQMFSAVKMNLSAVSEQLNFSDHEAKISFDKTLMLVDESCKELRVIAHQMAPSILLKFGLVRAVADFLDKINSRSLSIKFSSDGLENRIQPDIEMVLYRVIQEAVNNVIKHASAKLLTIQLSSDTEGISVMIEDDGIGFDIDKLNEKAGIGLRNMRSRVAYLKGNVDFSSSPNAGTLVAIFIPIA